MNLYKDPIRIFIVWNSKIEYNLFIFELSEWMNKTHFNFNFSVSFYSSILVFISDLHSVEDESWINSSANSWFYNKGNFITINSTISECHLNWIIGVIDVFDTSNWESLCVVLRKLGLNWIIRITIQYFVGISFNKMHIQSSPMGMRKHELKGIQ